MEDDPRGVVFTQNVARGELCVFLPGHLEFLAETNVTVNSILQFMPGVRVSIATGIYDFHAYNRTVGQHPAVHVWNSSYADFAALRADVGCGNGTKLIYYMSPGQMLSREFTNKDTHSPRGDLIVSYTEANKVAPENALRAMATTLILAQWTHHNVFRERSVWDIPLVKPHFSCVMDVGPSLQGFDVAEQMGKWMDGFRHGASCELGFKKMRKGHLNTKPHWEFGPLTSSDTAENDRTKLGLMPSLKNYNISVMFRTFFGDAVLFNVSLPTVAKHFPDAKEVVVVVEESDGELFEGKIKPHQATAPFPIRVVTEPDIMDGHIQQKYSKLRGDMYCEGDFILHLDSDVVLFEPLTYDHIFHLGKPVLPYPAIRDFIEQHHGVPFEEFMASRRGKCRSVKTLATWTREEQTLLLSDFNLMGAYLWYHMHDKMHWMATDPYDIQVNAWRRDVTKYAWVCQANGRHVPEDTPGEEQYISGLLSVENFNECVNFKHFWKRNIMKNPETREPNPPRFQESY
eukprot:g8996.t1